MAGVRNDRRLNVLEANSISALSTDLDITSVNGSLNLTAPNGNVNIGGSPVGSATTVTQLTTFPNFATSGGSLGAEGGMTLRSTSIGGGTTLHIIRGFIRSTVLLGADISIAVGGGGVSPPQDIYTGAYISGAGAQSPAAVRLDSDGNIYLHTLTTWAPAIADFIGFTITLTI